MEPSRVMFGSDYPYIPQEMADGLKHVKLEPSEATGMYQLHVEKLFPRFKV